MLWPIVGYQTSVPDRLSLEEKYIFANIQKMVTEEVNFDDFWRSLNVVLRFPKLTFVHLCSTDLSTFNQTTKAD
ncbi:MAG: hypothetical protein CL811_02570 [Colwelliaceae bacterium]|nr:hypothetical protein [Colwelliaceae bacterium]